MLNLLGFFACMFALWVAERVYIWWWMKRHPGKVWFSTYN
jgi:hypothetical protein